MNVLHVSSDFDRDSGGPSRSIPQLADALSCDGWQGTLCGMRTQSPIASSLSMVLLEDPKAVQDLLVDPSDPSRKSFDTIHINGLWQPLLKDAASMGGKHQIPAVWAPRGMLEPWALSHKKWKKRLAWWLYQKRALACAQVLHATSQLEADNLRGLGLKQPIAVIPNGVERPELSWVVKNTGHRETRTILFLSRLQKKKGLMELVEAWSRLENRDGWRVRVVGPDEEGYRQTVEKRACELGVRSDFSFEEPIDGAEKWKAYAAADVFVLPTHSENFGIVVAEALAAGTPVVTTKGAPWSELQSRKCGWWIDLSVERLAETLAEAVRCSDVERNEMGERGRKLVEEKYCWPGIARQMALVYRWMLEGEALPECVRLD